MSDIEEPLPGLLTEIADLIGRDAALLIANARGGTQIYLPPNPGADHWLSELIGHDKARKLGAEIACGIGIRLDVPLGPAGRLNKLRDSINTLMNSMLREGRSEREIVLATGFSSRTVRRRRSELRDPSNNPSTTHGTPRDCQEDRT